MKFIKKSIPTLIVSGENVKNFNKTICILEFCNQTECELNVHLIFCVEEGERSGLSQIIRFVFFFWVHERIQLLRSERASVPWFVIKKHANEFHQHSTEKKVPLTIQSEAGDYNPRSR